MNAITPLTGPEFDAAKTSAAKENYVKRVAVVVDDAANVATDGLPGETISSRWADAAIRGKWWGKVGSKFLDLFQKDHGAHAQAGDTERAEAVLAKEEQYDGGLK